MIFIPFVIVAVVGLIILNYKFWQMGFKRPMGLSIHACLVPAKKQKRKSE